MLIASDFDALTAAARVLRDVLADPVRLGELTQELSASLSTVRAPQDDRALAGGNDEEDGDRADDEDDADDGNEDES